MKVGDLVMLKGHQVYKRRGFGIISKIKQGKFTSGRLGDSSLICYVDWIVPDGNKFNKSGIYSDGSLEIVSEGAE